MTAFANDRQERGRIAELEAENAELREDQRKLDYVLDVLGIAETDRDPADCVKEWITRAEAAKARATAAERALSERDAQVAMLAKAAEDVCATYFVASGRAIGGAELAYDPLMTLNNTLASLPTSALAAADVLSGLQKGRIGMRHQGVIFQFQSNNDAREFSAAVAKYREGK